MMKAITLTAPYATLIAIGAKHIETRSWSTSYRGPLAIHQAAGLGPIGGRRGLHALCGDPPFCDVLLPAGYSAMRVPAWGLPLGAIVATCDLVAIMPTQNAPIGVRGETAILDSEGRYRVIEMTDQEIAFGLYTPGRYAWFLANIKALPEPIPAKGALSLWEWNP